MKGFMILLSMREIAIAMNIHTTLESSVTGTTPSCPRKPSILPSIVTIFPAFAFYSLENNLIVVCLWHSYTIHSIVFTSFLSHNLFDMMFNILLVL